MVKMAFMTLFKKFIPLDFTQNRTKAINFSYNYYKCLFDSFTSDGKPQRHSYN